MWLILFSQHFRLSALIAITQVLACAEAVYRIFLYYRYLLQCFITVILHLLWNCTFPVGCNRHSVRKRIVPEMTSRFFSSSSAVSLSGTALFLNIRTESSAHLLALACVSCDMSLSLLYHFPSCAHAPPTQFSCTSSPKLPFLIRYMHAFKM